MVVETLNEEMIWSWLDEIPDPEIPVISVVELGVVRKVELVSDLEAIVTITPTYSGCPAMNVFETDIVKKLKEKGLEEVQLITVLSPAWTSNWLSDKAHEKLRKYGIAPPVKGSEDKGLLFQSTPKTISCPKCNSAQTELVSQFGSTACKSLYKCESCQEPFEYFKCI